MLVAVFVSYRPELHYMRTKAEMAREARSRAAMTKEMIGGKTSI
jgi:hypothetical protein